MSAKRPIPFFYWPIWWAALLFADVIFYVVLTPLWIGLRTLAWIAEYRARRRS